MTTSAVITAIGYNPVTLEGLELRLHVAGVGPIPNLQSILDGLAFAGKVKTSVATGRVWYELTNPPKWEPSDGCEIPTTLAKHPERKLDWMKPTEPKAEVAKPNFKIVSFDPPKSKIPVYDLETEILAVLDHDAPSTLTVLNRLRNRLTVSVFELNFFDVKNKLFEMKEKGLVGQMKATETTAGGWIQPRKNPIRKQAQ